MYNFLNKNGQTIAFLIGGALALVAFLKGANEDVSLPINIAGALMIGALVIWVLMELLSLLGQPKKAIKGIIGIIALLVIFFIAKSIGSSPNDAQIALDNTTADTTVTENTVNWIGGGIVATAVLIGLALLAFLWGELKSLFS